MNKLGGFLFSTTLYNKQQEAMDNGDYSLEGCFVTFNLRQSVMASTHQLAGTLDLAV